MLTKGLTLCESSVRYTSLQARSPKRSGLVFVNSYKSLALCQGFEDGDEFFLHILALFSGKSLTFAKICPWKKRGTLKEGMMEKLMPRVDYWYANAGRTARGRSASEVVLQSLGINGGGILAGTELLSKDKQGIQTSPPPNPFLPPWPIRNCHTCPQETSPSPAR